MYNEVEQEIFAYTTLEKEVNQYLAMNNCKFEVCKGYGMTELSATAVITFKGANAIGSVGIPLVANTIKIVDPDTMKELGYNQTGEIWINGPSIMLGYYKMPNETSELIFTDDKGIKWVRTGDVGHITEDGLLFHEGRIRRIYMTAYEGQPAKIFPMLVEDVLKKSPSVSECSVVGRKRTNSDYYEAVAFVVKTNAACEEDRIKAELTTLCTENLPTYMMPVQYCFIEQIPHTPIWDKKKRHNSEEDMAIFYDTHEAIVSEEVFEKVQQIREQRHRKTKTGRTSMFSGLVFCSDCGEKLYYGATNNYKPEGAFFECSLHWKHKEKCGAHFIREKVLNHLVLRHIQLVTGYILRHQQHFISVMEQHLRVESSEKMKIARKQLERNEKRIAELKRLFIKIYEDNAKGKLSDERFDMMSQTYEAEQKQLEAEVVTLLQEMEVQERQNENIEKFIQKAHKYVGIEELDPYALRELVKAIYVDAPVKVNGKRTQHIHIQYDGIGFIPLDELLKEETA